MMTKFNIDIDDVLVGKRLTALINQVFKILPMHENGDEFLPIYIASLEREMLGYRDLILALGKDDQYLSLLAILEYIGNYQCDTTIVRREVFKAINILKKLHERYVKEAA